MKKITPLFILFGILFAACFKKDDIPPLKFNGEANMTIADFQKLRVLSASSPTLIDTAAIISGIVTSTDKFGSCYKEIFIQDETGGISIRINNTSYNMKYRIGQRVFVKAQGLYLGNYISGARFGFYQLGLYGNANGGLEYISQQRENQHIFRDGHPGPQPAPKIVTSVADVNKGIGGDFHTLVKLVNCYFTQAGAGAKYYEDRFVLGGAANQPIRFNSGGTSEIVARISSPAYCSFANEVMPEGTVTITGILTMFGNDIQLIIRSIEDVQAPPVAKDILTFDMKTDIFTQGWTKKQVKGTDEWIYSASSKYVKIQSDNETECWLISPKLNFTSEKNVALYFLYNVLDGTKENTQVLFTIDGTNWTPLEFTPQEGNAEALLKLNENIATNPNLQIAFQYKTTTEFPTWYIKSIIFKANAY